MYSRLTLKSELYCLFNFSDTEVNYFRAGIVFTDVIHYYSHYIGIRHVTDGPTVF